MNTSSEQTKGIAQRHDNWEETTSLSSIGRKTLSAVPNYKLLKAATQIGASAGARLLLVHLIGYLGQDEINAPAKRFVAFPGNQRLSDELGFSKRTIQRQADELEGMGMIRRCYNGLNHRTGFDLTPFAAQHDRIITDMVAIHSERKIQKAAAQMEMSLSADRIERPNPVSDMSSKGDATVTHNRPDISIMDVRAKIDKALDKIDLDCCLKRLKVSQDRGGDPFDIAYCYITNTITQGGRASHLGWTSAISQLGRYYATALYLAAQFDPNRKSSTERYFGWLLKMVRSPDGSDPIIQAAQRATRALSSNPAPKTQPKHLAAPHSPKTIIDTPRSNETSDIADIRKDLRLILGKTIYETWISKSDMCLMPEGCLSIKVMTEFQKDWIEDRLAPAICEGLAKTGCAVDKIDVAVLPHPKIS